MYLKGTFINPLLGCILRFFFGPILRLALECQFTFLISLIRFQYLKSESQIDQSQEKKSIWYSKLTVLYAALHWLTYCTLNWTFDLKFSRALNSCYDKFQTETQPESFNPIGMLIGFVLPLFSQFVAIIYMDWTSWRKFQHWKKQNVR